MSNAPITQLSEHPLHIPSTSEQKRIDAKAELEQLGLEISELAQEFCAKADSESQLVAMLDSSEEMQWLFTNSGIGSKCVDTVMRFFRAEHCDD